MAWNQNNFDGACTRFHNHFPDFVTFDCPGERYLKWERTEKDKLLELYRSQVQPVLLESDAKFFRAYVGILNPAAKQFIDWRFADDLSALARSDSDSSKYGSILKRVVELHGSSDSITTYGKEALKCLKSVYEPKNNPPYSDIRCLVTLLLMLHNPNDFMCEKLRSFNKSTKLLLDEELIEEGSQVTGEEFEKCQDFVKRVDRELKITGLNPKDMIDVQSFLFTVTGPRTWNQCAFESSIKQFKRRYSGFKDFKNCGEHYLQSQRKFKDNLLIQFREELKPLSKGDPIEFLNAYHYLISDDIDSHRPRGPEGWRVLTNEIPNEKRAQFGSMLQSLINAKANDWNPTEQYVKESFELLKNDIVMGNSHRIPEKLCESAALLFSLNWPKYSVYATIAVWNVVAKRFHGRDVIELDSILDVKSFREVNKFRNRIQEELVEAGLAPTDMFDIQSFLWSVYNEPSEYEPDPLNEVHVDAVGSTHNKEPSLSSLIETIKSNRMRIDDSVIRQYHFSMRTRGFVILAGPSGVGKTWLTSLYAKAIDANYLVAPVAPNWSTNEDLLGFFNPIDGEFHATRFLGFIDEAAELWNRVGSDAKEFHLVLDEMNLARVEHYFSLFLSLMEMRSEKRIPETRLAGDRVVRIPPNLKFAGTVNMDETTHGFADKVFDRAQLIELSISPDAAREHVSKRIGETPAAKVLLDLWERMAPACPVGFRVLNEIAEYLKLAEQEGVDWREALDEQIVSKLLPKLRGIDPEVAEVLKLIESRVNGEFPKAVAKCQSMLRRVRSTDVVSFF